MENKIIKKMQEIFSTTGKFPNTIKITKNNIDLIKSLNGFINNTTNPIAIGEIYNTPIIIYHQNDDLNDEFLDNIIEYYSNNELLGYTFIKEPLVEKNYKYKSLIDIIKLNDNDLKEETIKKWNKLGFLENLNDDLKLPVSAEMEKTLIYLKGLNGFYFDKEVIDNIYSIIKKILSYECDDENYTPIYLNVYDLLLFANFYYPSIKKHIESVINPNSENIDNITLETCLILCEYYEYFLKGIDFNNFLIEKNKK